MDFTITLPKIAAYGTRKIHAVDLEIRFRDGIISICGAIWNGSHTNCISCGQNIEEILELYPNNKLVREIHDVWAAYHLKQLPPEMMEMVISWQKHATI